MFNWLKKKKENEVEKLKERVEELSGDLSVVISNQNRIANSLGRIDDTILQKKLKRIGDICTNMFNSLIKESIKHDLVNKKLIKSILDDVRNEIFEKIKKMGLQEKIVGVGSLLGEEFLIRLVNKAIETKLTKILPLQTIIVKEKRKKKK